MYAVGCDKEDKEYDLEAGEGGIRCDNEGWCWSRRENGCKEIGKELRHRAIEVLVCRQKCASKELLWACGCLRAAGESI